jgi:hypothetical protein
MFDAGILRKAVRFYLPALLCFSVWCSPPVVAAADAPATSAERRTWSSADGRFKIDAGLVRQIGSRVVLRSADGAEFEVPRLQLSYDDLKFLEAQPRTTSKPPAAEFWAAVIVVELTSPGGAVFVPATVIEEREGFRYVATDWPLHGGYMNFAGFEGPVAAVLDAGARRVPLERVACSSEAGPLLLRAKAADLPAPLSFVDPKDRPERGDTLWFVSTEVGREQVGDAARTFRPTAKPVVSEAVVRESYFDLDGRPSGYLVELVAPTHVAVGTLFDQQGRPVGRVRAADHKDTIETSPETAAVLSEPAEYVIGDRRSAPPRLTFFYSFERPKDPLGPQLLKIVLQVPSAPGRHEVGIVVQVGVAEKDRPRQLQLLCVDEDGFEFDFNTSVAVVDGRWKDRPAEGSGIVELRRHDAVGAVADTLSTATWPLLQSWIGVLPIPAEAKRIRKLTCQCVEVTEAGYRPVGRRHDLVYDVPGPDNR